MSTDGGSTVRHAYPLLVCSQNQLGDSERQDLSLITAALGSSNLAQLSQWCCWKFPSLFFTCCFNTMSLTAAQQICKQTSVEEEMDVLQQDIAGFDHQVSHDRIVASIQYVISSFQQEKRCPQDHLIQASVHKHDRSLQVFRGRWRSQIKQYHGIKLCHIAPLTKYLLQHSIFRVGYCTFRQVEGAFMGAQWEPVMRSIVALNREHTVSTVCGNAVFSAKLSAGFRYVGNRFLLQRNIPAMTQEMKYLWNLGLYMDPILLEEVEG